MRTTVTGRCTQRFTRSKNATACGVILEYANHTPTPKQALPASR